MNLGHAESHSHSIGKEKKVYIEKSIDCKINIFHKFHGSYMSVIDLSFCVCIIWPDTINEAD